MVGLESSMENAHTTKKKSAEEKLLEQGWEKIDGGCYIDKSKRNDLYGHLMGQD